MTDLTDDEWRKHGTPGPWEVEVFPVQRPAELLLRAAAPDMADRIEALEAALRRIATASAYYAAPDNEITMIETLRYAHESTRRLAEAALNGDDT